MATVTFDYAETRSSWAGSLSETKNADRLYARADRTYWAGYVTGTECIVTATSDFGSNGDLIFASVDGGAYASAALSGGKYTVFTGLSDTEHFLVLVTGPAYGPAIYVSKTAAEFLTVTGAAPALRTFAGSLSPYPLDDALVSGIHTSNIADYLPANIADRATAYVAATARTRFTTDSTYLIILTTGTTPTPLVNINGAAAIEATSLGANSYTVALPSGTNAVNVCVWYGDIYAIFYDGTISADGNRIDQFGDSITAAIVAGGSGLCDVNDIAAHFGMLGCTYARGGWTVADLLTNLPTLTANSDITPGDVAILAIGRNSVDIETDPVVQGKYDDIINLLVARGYSKVLCRGVIPEIADDFAAVNAVIESIVDASAHPNVYYVDVSSWTGIETVGGGDTTHPSRAGYQQMVEYAKVSYDQYLSAPTNLNTRLGIGIGIGIGIGFI